MGLSRVSLIQQLYSKEKDNALEFNYDELKAPPIGALFSFQDIEELKQIAISVRYSGNINKKYELIDQVMGRRGFKRSHCGTNRIVYRFLEDPTFLAKVAVDKVGMSDTPREYLNQLIFKPYCCKIFEVDPSGVIGFVEKVNPISSVEEFMSISEDIFHLLAIKIVGKYVVEDLGSRTYMNFGVRDNGMGCTFGPVIIDYPYVYEIDGSKLSCGVQLINNLTGKTERCGGDIDYKVGFNGLFCTKCGKEYSAMDLAKHGTNIQRVWDQNDKSMLNDIEHYLRARIVDHGSILFDSGRQSRIYLSKEDFEKMMSVKPPFGDVEVEETIYKRRGPHIRKIREDYYTELQKQYCMSQLNSQKIPNPVIKSESVEHDFWVDKQTHEDLPYLVSNPKPASMMGKYAQPIETEADVSGYVSQEIVIQLTDPMKKTENDILEPPKQVSIEQPNVEESDSEELVADIVDDMSETVYSDEQVSQMAEEVSKANAEDTSSEHYDDDIIDPDRDRDHPEESPMTRPYAGAEDNHSVTYRDPSNLKDDDNPMSKAPRAQVVIDEAEMQARSLNPNKQYGHERHRVKTAKRRSKNKYDNNEDDD